MKIVCGDEFLETISGNRESEKRAKQVAILIIESADEAGRPQYLVGRRKPGQTLPGCDEFPGGAVHEGESPLAAALRESNEETGLCLRTAKPLVTVQHQYDFGLLDLHFFRARHRFDSSQVSEPFRWVGIDALGECDFPEANSAALQLLQCESLGDNQY